MPCVVVLRCPWEAECVSWTRNPRAAASSELAPSLALSQAPLCSERLSAIKSESLRQSLHFWRYKTSMQAITHNTPKNYPIYAQHGRGMPLWNVPGMTKCSKAICSLQTNPSWTTEFQREKKKLFRLNSGASEPAPSPSPPSSLTHVHRCIGSRNPTWQMLPNSATGPSPSPPSPSSFTYVHRYIGSHNPTWKTLPNSVRLTYLSVYDNGDGSSEPAPETDVSKCVWQQRWLFWTRTLPVPVSPPSFLTYVHRLRETDVSKCVECPHKWWDDAHERLRTQTLSWTYLFIMNQRSCLLWIEKERGKEKT